MNLLEKALAKAASLPTVRPGDQLSIQPSIFYTKMEQIIQVIHAFHIAGKQKVFCPEKVVFGLKKGSHVEQRIHHFCQNHGLQIYQKPIPSLFRDWKAKGRLTEGAVIVSTEPRIGCIGAMGYVSLLLSPYEFGECLGRGHLDFMVPETIYIELSCLAKTKVTVKNVIQNLLVYFHEDGLAGKGVVVGGKVMERLNPGEQMQIAERIYDMGGRMGLISTSGPCGSVEKVIKLHLE